jgi:hypothetical protein
VMVSRLLSMTSNAWRATGVNAFETMLPKLGSGQTGLRFFLSTLRTEPWGCLIKELLQPACNHVRHSRLAMQGASAGGSRQFLL